MTMRVPFAIATLAIAALAACGGKDSPSDSGMDSGAARDSGPARPGTGTSGATATPNRVSELTGGRDSAGAAVAFSTPESVKYDESLDGYFVTNINGNPGAKDNNGFILFVPAEGSADSARVVVRGGRGGAQLNGPKGMAITGDTLWVADIDNVRAFDKRTGRALASVPVRGAVFLNDVAIGPDGAVYVTDTGIRFSSSGEMSHPGPDRVYKVAGRTVTTAAQFDSLIAPNGIAWDRQNSRWVIAPFAGKSIVTIGSDGKPADFTAGVGSFDGIEQTSDGRWLVSSWADSSVYAIPAAGGAPQRLITGVNSPADIGYDSKRNRVLVPLFTENRVVVYQL